MDWSIFDWEQISNLLFSLLNAMLIPLAAFAGKVLVEWGKKQVAEASELNAALIRGAIKVFVFAAEQTMEAADGEAKLAYVLQKMEEWLAAKNITWDLDALVDEIEAVVYEELNRWE